MFEIFLTWNCNSQSYILHCQTGNCQVVLTEKNKELQTQNKEKYILRSDLKVDGGFRSSANCGKILEVLSKFVL